MSSNNCKKCGVLLSTYEYNISEEGIICDICADPSKAKSDRVHSTPDRSNSVLSENKGCLPSLTSLFTSLFDSFTSNTFVVEYKSNKELLDDISKRSEREMWSIEKKISEVGFVNRSCAGGLITITVNGIGSTSTNSEHFSVVIHGDNGCELHRQTFERSAGIKVTKTFYKNALSVFVSKPLHSINQVFIVDHFASSRKQFELRFSDEGQCTVKPIY